MGPARELACPHQDHGTGAGAPRDGLSHIRPSHLRAAGLGHAGHPWAGDGEAEGGSRRGSETREGVQAAAVSASPIFAPANTAIPVPHPCLWSSVARADPRGAGGSPDPETPPHHPVLQSGRAQPRAASHAHTRSWPARGPHLAQDPFPVEQDLRAGEQREAGQPPAPAPSPSFPWTTDIRVSLDTRKAIHHWRGETPTAWERASRALQPASSTRESYGNHEGEQAAMEKLSIQKHSRIRN